MAYHSLQVWGCLGGTGHPHILLYKSEYSELGKCIETDILL